MQPVVAGIVAAITGFASSFAIVLAGVTAVGATVGQAASGLFAICLAQGLLSILLSTVFRVPLKFAWSTPGAALLVATSSVTGRFAEAVGAFIVAAALIVVVGSVPVLGRLVARIPRPISSAMLAGILFPLCIAPVTAAVTIPLLALPVIAVWLVLYRLAPKWAVPAAIVLAGVLLALTVDGAWMAGARVVPHLEFVAPEFDPLVVASLAVPLFLVTMAGQNIPGATILGSYGFDPHFRASLIGSGGLSAVGALFGGIPVNLAALTQALTAGPEASPPATALDCAGSGRGHVSRTRGVFGSRHRLRVGVAADSDSGRRGSRAARGADRSHRVGAGESRASTRGNRDPACDRIRNLHRRHRLRILGTDRGRGRDALGAPTGTLPRLRWLPAP